MQPVGALLFGSYGDRHSRRTSLLFSLALIGAATLLIVRARGRGRGTSGFGGARALQEGDDFTGTK
jgi:MFS family permease